MVKPESSYCLPEEKSITVIIGTGIGISILSALSLGLNYFGT